MNSQSSAYHPPRCHTPNTSTDDEFEEPPLGMQSPGSGMPDNPPIPGNPQMPGFSQVIGYMPIFGNPQVPGNPQIPGQQQIPSNPQMTYPQMPSNLQMPGYPQMLGYSQFPGYPQMPGYYQMPGYPHIPGYPLIPSYRHPELHLSPLVQHQIYGSALSPDNSIPFYPHTTSLNPNVQSPGMGNAGSLPTTPPKVSPGTEIIIALMGVTGKIQSQFKPCIHWLR